MQVVDIIFPNVVKKSLKIPKGQSESVYRSRTDNTMAKKKIQKDKQRSTKHTYKTKDRVTRIPLKTGYVNSKFYSFQTFAQVVVQICVCCVFRLFVLGEQNIFSIFMVV
jgi:hypothetical protein